MIGCLVAAVVASAGAGTLEQASPPQSRPAAAAAPLAAGTLLLRGAFVPGRQPDGNTVLVEAPRGLIVIDTGRHHEHTQRIVDYASAARRPISAIVNTHWHLDHIGGNPRLRREFPQVRVHASNAIDEAMKGFLANYRKHLEGAVAKAAGDAEKERPLKAELAILDAGGALYPDEPITTAGERTIAGRKLEIGLETNAVTGGDVWIFDRPNGTLIAGDLVTLPVPFLDTACAPRWQQALDRLAKVPFQKLVPGHGPVLTPAQFTSYRRAFGALLTCAASSKKKEECADAWLADLGGLIPKEDHTFARSLLDYYFDGHLRGGPARNADRCRVSSE
jgi:glyoxylase-like metal-dependent hydrolase (beta-lactamase superfamily II)